MNADMPATAGALDRPLVSVVLTTRDRPRLLPVALAWLCQNMDDDDWYGPDFVRTMVDALLDSWRVACRPTVAFVAPFLFFDLARWEVRRSLDNNVPGATLLFRRDDWAERPFRALPGDEDFWFLRDQASLGASPLLVRGVESFVAIRHGGAAGRGHTWVRQASGETLEAYLLQRPLHASGSDGAVFVVPFDTNRAWKHGVPRSARDGGRRISVTFRASESATDGGRRRGNEGGSHV